MNRKYMQQYTNTNKNTPFAELLGEMKSIQCQRAPQQPKLMSSSSRISADSATSYTSEEYNQETEACNSKINLSVTELKRLNSSIDFTHKARHYLRDPDRMMDLIYNEDHVAIVKQADS